MEEDFLQTVLEEGRRVRMDRQPKNDHKQNYNAGYGGATTGFTKTREVT